MSTTGAVLPVIRSDGLGQTLAAAVSAVALGLYPAGVVAQPPARGPDAQALDGAPSGAAHGEHAGPRKAPARRAQHGAMQAYIAHPQAAARVHVERHLIAASHATVSDIASSDASQGEGAQPGTPTQTAGFQAVTYQSSNGAFIIVFAKMRAGNVSVRRDGRDLLLSFAGAAPEFDAQGLQDQAAGWLDGINVGYDALLLRLAQGVQAQVDAKPQGLAIVLARVPSGADQGAENAGLEDPAAELRMQQIDALLLVQEGRLSEARQKFETLKQHMPLRAEPLAGLASVEQQAGRWRRSLELYRKAISTAPDEPSYRAAARSIEAAQASRVRADLDHRAVRGGVSTSPADLTLGQVSGHWRLGEAWRVGTVVDTAQIHMGQAQDSRSVVSPLSGRRERGEVFAQRDALDGTVLIGSVFAGHGAAGVGVQARRPDDRGSVLLRGEYRRPNWDYTEGLLNGATRDRVVLGRMHRFGPALTGRIEVGYNRYELQKVVAARTASVSAEIRLPMVAGVRGLTAAYGIEGEYVTQRHATRPSADLAAPALPVIDREVHTVTLGFARTGGDRWSRGALSFDAYAGFGVDRYGRSGPLAAGTVGFAVGPVELQLRASYVRNIGRARATVAAIGGFAQMIF